MENDFCGWGERERKEKIDKERNDIDRQKINSSENSKDRSIYCRYLSQICNGLFHLKICTGLFVLSQMFLFQNSADPDQTAPQKQSDLCL